MRAGLLNDEIEVLKPTTERNAVGEQLTTYQRAFFCRCRVLRLANSRVNDNGEISYAASRQIQVRQYQDIGEYDHIRLHGKEYRITGIEQDRQQQCLIIDMEAEQ